MISTESLKQQVGRAPYVKRLSWKSTGSEYKATCPWHSDKNPSLSNYRKDGVWLFSCHPCEKHGDVIAFVMAHDGVKFPEAIKRIKEENGITEQKVSFKFNKEAAISALQTNTEALAYLASRGISPEFAKSSDLGLIEYPGIGPALAIPYSGEVVKFRALNPPSKGDKFRHIEGHPSKDFLYGIDSLCAFDSQVFVAESELDCLTMRAHGFAAVSVSSATTCLQKGDLIIREEDLKKLQADDRKIYLTLDQDAAGRACADAFEKILPAHQVYRLEWTYGGKTSTDPKDVGELYAQSVDGFYEKIASLTAEAQNRPPAWRRVFKSYSEMESGDIRFLIKDFLPEGVTFIGALSGSGKTWFALAMAKALTTGRRFLGKFAIPEPQNVIYMIPEAGERSFRVRMERMKIPNDRFLCRTMKDGAPLNLNDPLLLNAARELKPVIFLDTAVRFSNADSENDANQNARGLADGVFKLLQAGATAIVGIHHSPKSAVNAQQLTLENTLRGTGDLGAMCDAVYGLKVINPEKLIVKVACVKPRDFEPVPPFQIQGRPYINETGDFGLLLNEAGQKSESELLAEYLQTNPTANYRDISGATGIQLKNVGKVAHENGFEKVGNQWASARTSSAVN